MKRRANGEGSLYLRKDGRWCAYVTVGGHRLYHYARTQRACVTWLTEARHAGDGISLDANRVTLAQYLRQWLDIARRGLATATGAQYESTIRLHIVPLLGMVRLGKLRSGDIQSLYAVLHDRFSGHSGAGADTIHVVHAILSRSLRQAVAWGFLARSPAVGVTLPRRRRREVTTLSVEQVRTLLQAAHGHRFEALFVLAINTGMRHGELLGLRWPDVDWHGGTLRVQRQWTQGGYVAPKTAGSERLLPLGPDTLAALRAHRERQRFALAAKAVMDTEVVFCNAQGQALDRSTTLEAFHRLLAVAGLPRLRFHDLRHTAATLMLEQGVHPKVVQERLGHASISMTLDTYSHVTPGLQQAAADALDARIAVKPLAVM